MALGLLVAVLLAGGVSYYASSAPDGLERVAEEVGFGAAAQESAVADGPLADYQVDGIESERLSGGLAGVVGALVVLVLSGGLTLLLRRGSGHEWQEPDEEPAVFAHSSHEAD